MNGKTFSLVMSALNTFFIFPTLKTISYGANRRVQFCHCTKLKEAPNGWFGVAWQAAALLTNLTLTLTHKDKLERQGYYITKILEKEMKPLFSCRSTTEEPVKWKLFTHRSSATLVQDGTTALMTKTTQQWCKRNLSNFIHIENLWSFTGEAAHRDPIPKTMGGLKSRLRQAWRNAPLASIRELAHSMLQWLKNVIQNNEGHSGYWCFNSGQRKQCT